MILINNHNLNTIKMYKLVWLIGVLPGQAENTATQKGINENIRSITNYWRPKQAVENAWLVLWPAGQGMQNRFQAPAGEGQHMLQLLCS